MIEIRKARFKSLIKNALPNFPFYSLLCMGLRKLKSRYASLNWIDRLPIKPGMIVPLNFDGCDLFMTHPERCSIAKKLFWDNGVRQPAEDKLALDLFANLSKKANVILDIGANSGIFSLVAAKSNPKAKIIAFDILPESYHILSDNLLVNGLLGKVEIRLVGVGAHGIFYAPFNNISSEMPTSLSLESSAIFSNQVKVPVMTLDEICIHQYLNSKTIMLIKIDVEGTEFDIFNNGRKTLEQISPDLICEILSIAKNVEIYDKILDELGYKKYLITDNGLVIHDYIKADSHFKDWYFTKNDIVNFSSDLSINKTHSF